MPRDPSRHSNKFFVSKMSWFRHVLQTLSFRLGGGRNRLIIRKFGRARRVTSWWSSGALRAAASLVVLSLGFPTHPLASSEVEYQRSGVRSTSRRRRSDDQKVSVAAEQNPKIMIKSLCQRPSSAQEGWPTLLERTGKLLLLAAER